MTCRIDRRVVEDVVVLRICGRITRQDADMLRALLEQETRVVAIDLRHVLLIDHEAVKLLALHQSKGSELRNCPAYISEWVTREIGGCEGMRHEIGEAKTLSMHDASPARAGVIRTR